MSKHDQTDFPPHWSPPPHVAQSNPVPPINDLIEVLIQESPAEWVRAIFLEKFRSTTEQTLTRYGIVSDEQLSSTLRILDRLPLSEWLPDDEWRRTEAIGFLRQLSSNSNRVLSESDKACLQRILEKLPPLATTEDLDYFLAKIDEFELEKNRSTNEDVKRSSSELLELKLDVDEKEKRYSELSQQLDQINQLRECELTEFVVTSPASVNVVDDISSNRKNLFVCSFLGFGLLLTAPLIAMELMRLRPSPITIISRRWNLPVLGSHSLGFSGNTSPNGGVGSQDLRLMALRIQQSLSRPSGRVVIFSGLDHGETPTNSTANGKSRTKSDWTHVKTRCHSLEDPADKTCPLNPEKHLAFMQSTTLGAMNADN